MRTSQYSVTMGAPRYAKTTRDMAAEPYMMAPASVPMSACSSSDSMDTIGVMASRTTSRNAGFSLS